MKKENFCHNCIQEHQCQEAWRLLGGADSPGLTGKVVLAFLVPLTTFIVALAVCRLFLKNLGGKQLQTIITFLLALAAVFIYLLIIKAVNKKKIVNNLKNI